MKEKIINFLDKDHRMSMEQRHSLRRNLENIWELFIIRLKQICFVMPVIFSFNFYSEGDISKAIFWSITSLIGYQIYKNK